MCVSKRRGRGTSMHTDKSTQLLCVWQNCLPQKVFNRIETCQRLKYRVGLDKRMLHIGATLSVLQGQSAQIHITFFKSLATESNSSGAQEGLILSSKRIYLFLSENCKPATIHTTSHWLQRPSPQRPVYLTAILNKPLYYESVLDLQITNILNCSVVSFVLRTTTMGA